MESAGSASELERNMKSMGVFPRRAFLVIIDRILFPLPCSSNAAIENESAEKRVKSPRATALTAQYSRNRPTGCIRNGREDDHGRLAKIRLLEAGRGNHPRMTAAGSRHH